jgi:hypothetical protein
LSFDSAWIHSDIQIVKAKNRHSITLSSDSTLKILRGAVTPRRKEYGRFRPHAINDEEIIGSMSRNNVDDLGGEKQLYV